MRIFQLIMAVYVLVISACSAIIVNTNEPIATPKIVQMPRNTYAEDEPIILKSQGSDRQNLHWTSSLQGELGSGAMLIVDLQIGLHTISLMRGKTVCDNMQVNITAVNFLQGGSRSILLNSEMNQLLLPAGGYSPYCISYADKQPNIACVFDSLISENAIQYKSWFSRSISPKLENSNDAFLNKRLFSISVPKKNAIESPILSRRKALDLQKDALLNLGDSRTFIVADTTGENNAGHQVSATAVFITPRVHVFLDNLSTSLISNMESFFHDIDVRILTRVFQIWGNQWADIDFDGAITVLITPIINKEQKAVGFFNPNDLYPYNDDINSANYNIVSNGIDIIYLADPGYNPSDFSYSKDSILATFAHETTHLINFSKRVRIPEIAGSKQTIQEELFLDEGMAHLTESLCGYGVSGGNLAFYSVYLRNTANYALNGIDFNGASDSIGKRGMTSAFLSWLFWKKGGIAWNIVNDGQIIDLGGITFLRKLQTNTFTGMENIGDSFGAPVNSIFQNWIDTINRQKANLIPYDQIVNDPITNQAITMDPFYGDLFINGINYSLNGPRSYSFNTAFTGLSYSAIWCKPVTVSLKHTIQISSQPQKGTALYAFTMN